MNSFDILVKWVNWELRSNFERRYHNLKTNYTLSASCFCHDISLNYDLEIGGLSSTSILINCVLGLSNIIWWEKALEIRGSEQYLFPLCLPRAHVVQTFAQVRRLFRMQWHHRKYSNQNTWLIDTTFEAKHLAPLQGIFNLQVMIWVPKYSN